MKNETLPRLPPSDVGDGIFNTKPEKKLMSASTVVVSALVPTTKLYPGGTAGSQWTSFTIEFPSGVLVPLGELFSKPHTGLVALALATRRYFSTPEDCGYPSDTKNLGNATTPNPGSLAPDIANYQNYALTKTGLVIGFGDGQVISPACGAAVVTVPYSLLWQYLSPLGHRLVAGIRQPLFPRSYHLRHGLS